MKEDIKTQKNEKMEKEQKEEQRNFEAALNGFVLPEVSRLILLIAKQGQCWTRPAALRVVEDTFILINQSTTTFVDIIWYRIVHFVPLWFWTSTLLLAYVYMVSFAVYIEAADVQLLSVRVCWCRSERDCSLWNSDVYISFLCFKKKKKKKKKISE